jgi:hypothetical protein
VDQFFPFHKPLEVTLMTPGLANVPETVCADILVVAILIDHCGDVQAADLTHLGRTDKSETGAVSTPNGLDLCRSHVLHHSFTEEPLNLCCGFMPCFRLLDMAMNTEFVGCLSTGVIGEADLALGPTARKVLVVAPMTENLCGVNVRGTSWTTGHLRLAKKLVFVWVWFSVQFLLFAILSYKNHWGAVWIFWIFTFRCPRRV